MAGPDCVDETKDAKHITFGAAKLAGIVLGKGQTGIVLAHQNGGSVCQWLLNAELFAARGYLVLAFDFSGFGGSPGGSAGRVDDVREAADAVRAEGATQVVLIGASMGGTAVIAAAAEIEPPVRSVISVSAPATFGGVDSLAAAPKLSMPVLYLCASGESAYATAAQALHKASSDAQLLIVPGATAHGVELVMPGSGEKAAIEGVDAFLLKHAPAR